MYCKFYGFREKPFSIIPNPAFLYPSSKHRMAMTYLEYGLAEGTGFILLTGEIGSGKTTLIKRLLNGLGSDIEVAVLFNTNVSAGDLLKLILQEYEIEPGDGGKSGDLDLLNHFLIEKFSQGKRSLLIIDEAQNLSREALEEVRMLSNLQTETAPLLQIVLVGQPELKLKMRHPSLAQLAQRVTVGFHLGSLTRTETGEYIVYRLESAGASRTDLFTEDAVDLIHEKSRGIPRSVNVLCDAALVYGFADELENISREVVENVVRDREMDGVVPDSVPAPEEGPVPSPEEAGDNGFLSPRVRSLEARVEKLSALVEHQSAELQSRMEQSRDELVRKLEDLLEKERKRGDKLVGKCSDLWVRIREMEKKAQGEQKENSCPVSEKNNAREERKPKGLSGILKRFGG